MKKRQQGDSPQFSEVAAQSQSRSKEKEQASGRSRRRQPPGRRIEWSRAVAGPTHHEPPEGKQ